MLPGAIFWFRAAFFCEITEFGQMLFLPAEGSQMQVTASLVVTLERYSFPEEQATGGQSGL